MQRGACLCGEVAFVVEAEVHDPIACHCRECRRQSGHYFAAVPAPKAAVRMTEEAGLTWYRASDKAARGFCRTCGSTLFWRADEGATVMVAMGALEAPTGMRLSGHYWVDEKGSYYEITDGLPQHKGGRGMTTRGACLCGAVRLRIEGELPDPWACHCGQCRKQTGHYLASIEVPRACVAFKGLDAVGRYHASERAERGFCRTCGSSLYWRLEGAETIWIAMGLFDEISGLHLTRHVHLADKGDYYDLPEAAGESR